MMVCMLPDKIMHVSRRLSILGWQYLHPKGALLAELNRKKAQAESAAASSAGSLLYFKGTGKGKLPVLLLWHL